MLKAIWLNIVFHSKKWWLSSKIPEKKKKIQLTQIVAGFLIDWPNIQI